MIAATASASAVISLSFGCVWTLKNPWPPNPIALLASSATLRSREWNSASPFIAARLLSGRRSFRLKFLSAPLSISP